MTALPLDPARLRALFPAFAEPSLQGQAFFENAGGSYTAQSVLDRLEHFSPTAAEPEVAVHVAGWPWRSVGCVRAPAGARGGVRVPWVRVRIDSWGNAPWQGL